MYSSVSTPLIHMNAWRLRPCQAGLNSPVGLMKEDNGEWETEGGERQKERARERVQKLLVDRRGVGAQKRNKRGINIQASIF